MDTKLIKQKILDLAIRGKLVPQNPADEPASVLLERIKAEKAQLIKEGKIKKEKPLAPIEEVPFEIPESWEWTTIGDFTGDLKYGTAEKSLPEGRVAVLRMGNITRDGSIDYADLVYTNNELDIEKYLLKEGDILFNRTNSSEWVGKCAIYHEGIPAIYAGYIIRFTPIGLNPEYINYVMISGYERDYCAKVKTDGINQSNINSVKLAKFQVPIPPLEEQKRIVAEIDRWFKWIDELEQNQQDLHTAIKQAKSKILDLAIHGKLVPQDANDEPALELLRKLGISNQFSEAIPGGWALCTLEEITEYEQPQKYIVSSTDYADFYKTPVLTAGKSFIIGYTNEEDGIFTNLPVIIFDDFTTDSKYVDFPFKVKSSAMKILKVVANIDIKYVTFFMSKTRLIGQTHKRYWISEYCKLLIPIPPYNEQKRIVSKIEELFAQLDKIEESLN